MKKNNIAAIQLIILSFLIIQGMSSCSTGGKWNDIEFYDVEKLEQLTEKPVADDEEIVELRDSDDRTMDVKVDMHFMKSAGDANENVCELINQQLVEIVLGQPKETNVDEAIELYIAERKKEFHTDNILPSMHDYVTGRAEYGIKNIINYRVTEELYTGGAHPLTITTLFVFDALTGEYLTLEKLFPPTQQDDLKSLLLAKLMQNNDVETIEALNEKGFLEMSDMFVSNNIAFRTDSVEFFYNPYDIAPYALGPCTICLDYESIKPLCVWNFE